MENHNASAQQTRASHRRRTDPEYRYAGHANAGHDQGGYGHAGHGHGPAAPADRRVLLAIVALLVPCALATLIGLLVLFPSGRSETEGAAAAVPRHR